MSHRAEKMQDAQTPLGLDWVLGKSPTATQTGGTYEPWYFLERAARFDLRDKWPHGSCEIATTAFARRQDNDDIACFSRAGNGFSILVVHGWVGASYAIIATYPDFWAWMKSVVDDMAEWSDR